MNNLSELLLEAADLLTEGAVKTNNKKKIDKWLKKYNYKEGTIKGQGVITVDDNDYVLYRNKGKTAAITGKDKPGFQVSINEKDFKSYKNNKRRDAMLQHEIGHLKLHGENLSDKNDIVLKGRLNKRGNNMSDTQWKNYIQVVKDDMNERNDDSIARRVIERDKNIKKFDKYAKGKFNDGSDYDHINTNEFEADRYAANKVGTSQIKRAMRDDKKASKKYFTKEQANGFTNKEFRDKYNLSGKEAEKLKKEYLADQHSQHDLDNKQRSKALKDKSINNKVYQESIAVLLTETALLLNNDYETLNEGVSDTLKFCALITSAIGLGVWIHMDDKKQKKLREEKEKEYEKKREEENKRKEKEFKIYIDTISNKELKITSKEDLMESIFKDIKTIVSVMKKDKKYYNKIKERVKNEIKEYPDEYFDGLICRQFDEKYGYEIIEIINGSQWVKSTLWYVITDIEYLITKKYAQPIKDFNLKISTGDGDEGCFYMD